jgi:hypothetical protein
MDIGNQVRGYAFFLSVLRGEQADPYCRSCNSFVKTLAAARESFDAFASQNADAPGGLPADLARLYAEAKSGLDALRAPDQPVSQKKAGNCRLPEGVCFLKSSFALLQKM